MLSCRYLLYASRSLLELVVKLVCSLPVDLQRTVLES